MFIVVPKLATNCEFRVSTLNPYLSLDEFFVVHSLTLFPRIFHYHGDKKYSFLGGIGLLVNIWVVKSPYFIFFHYFDLLVAQIQKWELFVPLSIFCLYGAWCYVYGF